MKLAFVTAYPPSKVTLNEYAYHLVKAFRQDQNVTELVLLTDKTKEPKALDFETEGCLVKVRECWDFNKLGNCLSIAKTLREERPDAVLFNLQFMKFGDNKVAAALGLMTPMISRMMGIPTISLLHNILEEVDLNEAGFTKNPILKWGYNLIGSFLTRLVLRSNMVAVTIDSYVHTLKSKYKVNNVKLIPHGTFEIPEQPDFDKKSDCFTVMTFGKFGTYKKVEGLIEAFNILQNSYDQPMKLVIAGTDNPNVPGYLNRMKETFKEVDNVEFTGYVEEDDVPGIFNESSVVVFPYTSTTGSSGVLHQAGSYGKAVIMPQIGDLAHLIQDEGYTGVFFKPDSVESLQNALQQILDRPDETRKMGMTNYKAATAFPMSRIAQMYVDSFKSVITKRVSKMNVVTE